MIKNRLKNTFCIWVISVFMIASTCLTSFASTNITKNISNTDPLEAVPENFQYIYGKAGDLYSVYTYSVNGIQYKVVDNASADWMNVKSEIYKMNSEHRFELYATETLVHGLNNITVTVDVDGNKDIEVFSKDNSNVGILEEYRNSGICELNSKSGETFDGMPVSNWQYYGTFNDFKNITKYTVAVVIGLIGFAVCNVASATWVKAVSTGVETVAQMVVADKISKVYYKCTSYYKTVLPSDSDMFRMKIAEQNHYVYYTDSNRTQKIGTGSTYYYHKDFVNHY